MGIYWDNGDNKGITHCKREATGMNVCDKNGVVIREQFECFRVE